MVLREGNEGRLRRDRFAALGMFMAVEKAKVALSARYNRPCILKLLGALEKNDAKLIAMIPGVFVGMSHVMCC